MSKSHKKRVRNQSAFSGTPAKGKPETSSESSKSEPIKLERVLVSDEFYWEVPGDVPASDRRYGMKMVPPGVPKPGISTENSKSSSLIPAAAEKAVSQPAIENKDAADTNTQAQNKPNATQQVDNVSVPLVAENKSNRDTSPQFQKNTAAEDYADKTDSEIKPGIVASKSNDDVVATPPTESKSKVAATILPRTDAVRMEAAPNRGVATTTSEATGTTRADRSQQETVISNKKLEAEQVVPSKLKYLEENNRGKDGRSRRGWIVWPLLLLLAAGLYDALFNEEQIDVATLNELEQPIIKNDEPVEIVKATEIVEKETIAEKPVQAPLYYITHVVVKGDTLWDISKKYLDDPFRYPELAESSNIKNPDLIYPGEVITIATTKSVESHSQAQLTDMNVAANVEASQLQQVLFTTHVVVKGDTLWAICKKYLNNPFRYPEVAKLSKIKNPDLIYPGDIIRMQMN